MSGAVRRPPNRISRIGEQAERSFHGGSGGDATAGIDAVLEALAQAGGMDLSFLRQEGLQHGDVRRAMGTLVDLSTTSQTAATVFMVNVVLGGALIAIGGTPEQRERLLPALSQGSLQLAFAMTEPDAGSDAASMRTWARPVDDGFLLTGEKRYITGALRADPLLVVARTGEGRRFGVFLVPRPSRGLQVTAMPKLSANMYASCYVVLDDVFVPKDAVLGGIDGVASAWDVLRQAGTLERLSVAAMSVGMGSSIVAHCLEFAKEREQFGVTIGSFQSIQHALVEMIADQRASQLLLEDAIDCFESGNDPTIAVSVA